MLLALTRVVAEKCCENAPDKKVRLTFVKSRHMLDRYIMRITGEALEEGFIMLPI